jgi:ABC-type molybdate transport system ATPase subunit
VDLGQRIVGAAASSGVTGGRLAIDSPLVKLCTMTGEKTPLLARITRHSRDRLRRHEGQSVFAQVKAVP